ncbi:MAG: PstS family phosphate ABC transporter substrate-binding protein [Gemmatimonadetes bacterium]|uniref:Phosphate-binding protein n=1 Tax=Candidatus Kutchimonas denitrificans TaxID=3056748 RepID=A0AAE4Z994_9BACT|nr:PstS family phosphate ABC transporter substrate-binding protein [Gemmatimonadota bacterium]NIR74827.1 PstS family phosphate ABC transporter substrate-binding protein [Candidatus Kutchimonas denitrificans]NIR99938.1 PstS family phosphate ABC transporter substrate-binding protein [Gemmatimonadota bacterium]NIT65522.1 PstS family phosphate ABC transporter substrate-binding protein [Gemmatimonadota bacterium]NIU52492.1 phosphate ABC transporter substrate-binding protein PstS family protein [Gemm
MPTKATLLFGAILHALVGCAGGDAGGGVEGSIHIDGSSTVYPVTEAVVEQFQAEHRRIRVAVGVSGTGGGFKKFCAAEAELADASRRIKPAEQARCRTNGVEPLEFPVALDGLSVVVNPANDFVDCLTVEDLKRIWEPGSDIESWSQVRPEWPDLEMSLYGPGIDSGSFDYFTETIVGEEDASRADYAASEDDNVLVFGVTGDPGALGYFGHAYYVESPDLLKLVAVDAGAGCILPNRETVASGSYPLTRPLFLYVDESELIREEVVRFLRYYLAEAGAMAAEVGYVPMPAGDYVRALQDIERVTP